MNDRSRVRLRVWMYPEQSSDSSLESESTDNEGDSIADGYMSRHKKEPSPFSSKHVIHETLSSQDDENTHSKGLIKIKFFKSHIILYIHIAANLPIYNLYILR